MARPASAFHDFPVVNQAYAEMRTCLKAMIDRQNRPEIGRIVVPAWAYMHACVPEEFALPPLRHEANLVAARCLEMVNPLLQSGTLSPELYASRVSDADRLSRFINQWIQRPRKGRALAILAGPSDEPPTHHSLADDVSCAA